MGAQGATRASPLAPSHLEGSARPWLPGRSVLSLLIQALPRAGTGTCWNSKQPLGSTRLSLPCPWDSPRRSRRAEEGNIQEDANGPAPHSHQSRE